MPLLILKYKVIFTGCFASQFNELEGFSTANQLLVHNVRIIIEFVQFFHIQKKKKCQSLDSHLLRKGLTVNNILNKMSKV